MLPSESTEHDPSAGARKHVLAEAAISPQHFICGDL
jgi:hypothetical protein